MAIQIITEVDEIQTTDNDWWIVYDEVSKIINAGPLQCSGYTSSLDDTMVITNTEEELLVYIEENNLIIPIAEEE